MNFTTDSRELQRRADLLTTNVAEGLHTASGVVYENFGIFVAMSFDVLTGFLSLSMSSGVNGMPKTTPEWILVLIMGIMSFLGSAVQYVLWKIVWTVKGWYKKLLFFAPAILLMVIDTYYDGALANWIVYRKSPGDFPIAAELRTWNWWGIYLFLIITTGFNEAIVNVFRFRKVIFNLPTVGKKPVQQSLFDNQATQQFHNTRRQNPKNNREPQAAKYMPVSRNQIS